MHVVGADVAAAQLLARAAAVDVVVREVVRSQGEQLRVTVQAAASGRPGPNVITGAFRSGITLDVDGGPGHATATVSSTAPQAYRLEFGFRGQDRLGRTYNQPPYPSFGPAFDAMESSMGIIVVAAIREAL